MTVTMPQKSGRTPASQQSADPTREAARPRAAALIPFPGEAARRTRRIPRSDERRGEILLFLGVRYERLAS